MSYTFGVITHIEDGGNYAAALRLRVREGNGPYLEPDGDLARFFLFRVGVPVFELGEILVLDESGREVSGEQRKPAKWFVTCEEFTDLDEAVSRAREVEG